MLTLCLSARRQEFMRQPVPALLPYARAVGVLLPYFAIRLTGEPMRLLPRWLHP